MSRKQLEIRALVGERRRTKSGNWHLRCETDQGVAMFWGSDGNLHNISRIEEKRPPFRVTCDCRPSKWSAGELWIPENSTLEMHATGDSRPPEKKAPVAPRPDAPEPVMPVGGEQARGDWMDAMELVASDLRRLVRNLYERKVPIPVVGFELTSDTGVVLAEAELAWPDRNVAVLLPEQQDSKPAFEQAGWRVFHGDKVDSVDVLAATLDT